MQSASTSALNVYLNAPIPGQLLKGECQGSTWELFVRVTHMAFPHAHGETREYGPTPAPWVLHNGLSGQLVAQQHGPNLDSKAITKAGGRPCQVKKHLSCVLLHCDKISLARKGLAKIERCTGKANMASRDTKLSGITAQRVMTLNLVLRIYSATLEV